MYDVLVVAGGFSAEREVSLNTGKQIFDSLDRKKYNVGHLKLKDIKDLKIFNKYVERKDFIVFNALHGTFGEDGIFQGFCDSLGIKYTGSGVLASSLAMNKILSKKIFEQSGLLVPKHILIESWNRNIKTDFKYPVVVKPCSQGSSVGISIVRNPKDLKKALELAFKLDSFVIVEEYIEGMEITIGVLGNNPKNYVALPIIEIVTSSKYEFYSYDAKYVQGGSEHIIPARIEKSLEIRAINAALKAYKSLNIEVYARVDMIISKSKIYVLEVNTLPGMTETSLLPDAAKKRGMPFGLLLDTIIRLSLEKYEA